MEKEFASFAVDGRLHIFIRGEINESMTYQITCDLIEASHDPEIKSISMHVMSNGGSIDDALSIIDYMAISTKPIYTFGTGSVCSAAFLIYICGKKRYCGKRTRFMTHQPLFSENMENSNKTRLKNLVEELDLIDDIISDIILEHSNLDDESIKVLFKENQDCWFSPDQMIEMGMVDEITAPAKFEK